MDERGMFPKFEVKRIAPSSRGIDHSDCQYFVLDITHDSFAVRALDAYASACYSEHPQLAKDILRMLNNMRASREDNG